MACDNLSSQDLLQDINNRVIIITILTLDNLKINKDHKQRKKFESPVPVKIVSSLD